MLASSYKEREKIGESERERKERRERERERREREREIKCHRPENCILSGEKENYKGEN